MRECHGVLDARQVVGGKSKDVQRVLVHVCDGEVILEVSSSWPSGLTPDMARWIAKLLCEAAERVDAETVAAIAEIDDAEASSTTEAGNA